MNIQVATSELPVTTSIRGSSRLAGGNFQQRPTATRFRGARGVGVTARGKSF